MTSPTRTLGLLVITLAACDDVAPDEGRLPGGRYGLVAFNASGFEPFADDGLPVEHRSEGFANAVIEHPLDEAGQPAPTHLTVELQLGGLDARLGPARLWNHPNQLRVHLRQRGSVPLGTRTLFTADMESPRLRLEYRESATAPSRRYAGEGQLEVFAADLATGAAWGRFTGELHALDTADGPHIISAEFAAFPGPVYCSWEVPSAMPGRYRGQIEPPEGRADDCTPALDAVMAAEAHPDAPPVPDFQPAFYGLQRPPPRWDGLDRDL